MALYRDSKNEFPITYRDASGAVENVSSREFRMEFYQNGTVVTLTMGDGISFDTDGTDGVVNYNLNLSRTNQFSSGSVRIRQWDDSGDEPVLIHEGSSSIEGRSFDA